MEETNLSGNSVPLRLSDKEVFTQIWVSPRKVFKYINETGYNNYFYVLLVLSGISRAFDRASQKNMGDNMSIWGIIAISVLAGGLIGWLAFYIYAALLSWTGKWLNGRGDTDSLLKIICYGMIPSVTALVLLIPPIAVYGNEVYRTFGDITSAGWFLNSIVYGSMFLEFVFGVWTVVICIVGISEVQKLSIGKSILNAVLPVFVIFIPILIIVLLLRVF